MATHSHLVSCNSLIIFTCRVLKVLLNTNLMSPLKLCLVLCCRVCVWNGTVRAVCWMWWHFRSSSPCSLYSRARETTTRLGYLLS